ncbi:hypothetical protein ABEB36_001764 [Hypothenemus hampei]|uniref:Uncharacterized protein n=1 Tax=Hypothenemus hampei TaxID=57062 RepID=A0ABD1FFP7_HYPHA
MESCDKKHEITVLQISNTVTYLLFYFDKIVKSLVKKILKKIGWHANDGVLKTGFLVPFSTTEFLSFMSKANYVKNENDFLENC